jgi:hypothetical protein
MAITKWKLLPSLLLPTMSIAQTPTAIQLGIQLPLVPKGYKAPAFAPLSRESNSHSATRKKTTKD